MLKGFSTSAPRKSLQQVLHEFNQQTETEKQRVASDLAGKEQVRVKETPLLILESLQALEVCLHNEIPFEDKMTFIRALHECPHIVNDPAFRLRFLRCEQFHAGVSAK